MNIGEKFPEINAQNQHGTNIDFKKILGTKNIVLFFYPKDFTPGCTKEACNFRDNLEGFNSFNCEIIGISSDSEKRHLSFSNKYELNYNLIADSNQELRKLFKVPRNLFGLIPGRVTFVFNEKGVCIGTYNSMSNAEGHISYALNCLQKK
ncbi:MAG: peroxiredoxin [Crocinitomicaceae bacterium]|tara:strand:- start:14030 stop:14479 length:450 start_codon:yes stop_codon:yes gene_type:complete